MGPKLTDRHLVYATQLNTQFKTHLTFLKPNGNGNGKPHSGQILNWESFFCISLAEKISPSKNVMIYHFTEIIQN